MSILLIVAVNNRGVWSVPAALAVNAGIFVSREWQLSRGCDCAR